MKRVSDANGLLFSVGQHTYANLRSERAEYIHLLQGRRLVERQHQYTTARID